MERRGWLVGWVRGAGFFSRTGWETYATTRRALRESDVVLESDASTSQLTLGRSPQTRGSAAKLLTHRLGNLGHGNKQV